MKSLSAGERIIFEFSVSSKFGSCVAYVTNFGVSIENKRLGMILSVAFDDIASLLPMTKHSARLTWQEKGSTFEFVMQCEKPDLVCAKYRQAQKEYLSLQQSLDVLSQTSVQDIMVTNPIEKGMDNDTA
ncbi:MAG: hypothetical protein AB1608_07065 [Thermoproteota archaeon]